MGQNVSLKHTKVPGGASCIFQHVGRRVGGVHYGGHAVLEGRRIFSSIGMKLEVKC